MYKARTVLVCCLLFLPMLAACRDSHDTPSPQFSDVLDINRDREVTRAEWQVFNPDQYVASGPFQMFESADCDSNGRLAWTEYRNRIYSPDGCKEATVGEVSDPFEGKRVGILPIMFATALIDKALVSDASWVDEAMAAVASYPKNFHEASIPEETIDERVQFDCAPFQSALFPLHISALKGEQVLAAECLLQNSSSEFAVTNITLAIEMDPGGKIASISTATYVHPQSSEEFQVYIPGDLTPLSVSLTAARGMRLPP